jgi:hypothetical protein
MTPEELRAALAPLLRQLGKIDRRLLSKREAARRLGVDRNATLRDLIDRGEVRTVVFAGRVKIPASEIERIEQGGDRVVQPARAERVPQYPRDTKHGQAIRALKIG